MPGKGSVRTCAPVEPSARMERFACRGFVRVIFPRTMVPTSGRRAPVGRGMVIVGVLDVLEVEGVDIRGPAMLAKRLSPWM